MKVVVTFYLMRSDLASTPMTAPKHDRSAYFLKRWGLAAAATAVVCVLWFVYLTKQGRLLVLLARLAWAVGLHRSMAMVNSAGWVEDEGTNCVAPCNRIGATLPASYRCRSGCGSGIQCCRHFAAIAFSSGIVQSWAAPAKLPAHASANPAFVLS